MRFRPALRYLASWIACCAILLASLAPSISSAMASQEGQPAWLEICTAQGTKFIQVSAEHNPEAPASQPSPEHVELCPFCNLNPVANGLSPPTTDVFMATVEPQRGFPDLFYQAPRGLFVWTPASSRAPPVVA